MVDWVNFILSYFDQSSTFFGWLFKKAIKTLENVLQNYPELPFDTF